MNQLSELEDSQVNELQSSIIAAFEAVESEEPSSQTVDDMTALADMLDGVRGELKQREAAVVELAARATDAAARVHGETAKSEEGMPSDESETAPIPESEAAMQKDKVDEPVAAEAAPVTPEAPAAEADAPATPAPEEAPASEDEDEKEKKAMSEASTEVKKTSELSTEEVTAPVEAEVEEVVAEEAVAEVAEAEAEPEGEAAEEGASDEDASVDEDAEAEASVEPAATAEASADVPAEAEASTKESTEEITQPAAELSAQETMEAPVTASANAENLDIEVPADRRPVTKESYAPVAITAGADIPGYTAGSTLDSMSTVAEAMAKRIHSLRRVNGGDGEQHIVASVTTTFPENRTLDSDAESNWAKINEVVSPEAITAAGGHVAPFEARYEIFGFGTTARPVRDALPRFQADRGGIRFITPPILEDYEDATGVWTAANDAAGSPSPATKASLTVTAAGEISVATDAITLQMQFGNLATRAYPELIVRHNELGLIQHAREAEVQILSRIGTLSTAVTTSSLLGFGRDFLVQLGRAATAYRSRHRLEVDTSLRVIMPSWVKDAMAADLALSMPGDSTLNAYAEIDGYIAARGIQVSYTLDGSVFGTQGATALLEFSDTFVWYLFAEGTFLLLDGGTLDLGIIRDSTLVGTNDYKMFIETFEGVAKVGIESLAITSTINVNGAAAALRDTLGGEAAATIEY
jgi:hypothetical protein